MSSTSAHSFRTCFGAGSVETAASAAEQFAQQGGRELLVTGGEPFLHPDLGELVARTAEHVPVTVLTNAMVYARGRRREALESFDRDRVTLQISLDSAGPELHDRKRGAGSHRRSLQSIQLARELDFRVGWRRSTCPKTPPLPETSTTPWLTSGSRRRTA